MHFKCILSDFTLYSIIFNLQSEAAPAINIHIWDLTHNFTLLELQCIQKWTTVRFYHIKLIFETQLRILKPSYILVGLPGSIIKIWGKSVQAFLSFDRTNKQTDKQRLQL